MKRLNSKFITKYISEAGSSRENKDYFGFVELDNFACWAVAEGYDNDPDISSSQLAVDTVLSMFTAKPTLSKRKLRRYIKEAHKQLRNQSSKFVLQASILIVVTNYKTIRYALCGNCKLHIFRGSNIIHKSLDQSLYQDMINENILPEDSENGLEESRNLLYYLGKPGIIKPLISKKTVLQDEDIMVMTTWGFWHKISSVEMCDALEDVLEPMQYLDDLQDLFLSKQEEIIENYTIVAIFANKTFQEKDNKKKIIRWIIIISVILIIIFIILWIYFYLQSQKRKQTILLISESEAKGDVYLVDNNYDRALNAYDTSLEETKKIDEDTEIKLIKERLNLKQRVSQLLTDANNLYSVKNYGEAKINYEKALYEATKDPEFYNELNTELIRQKITWSEDNKYIIQLINLAESQAELGSFENALENFNLAKELAENINNIEAQRDIKIKSEEVLSKQKSQADAANESEKKEEQEKKEENNNAASAIELDGDKALGESLYYEAMDYYNQALELFKKNAAIDKAQAVQKKISDLNSLIKQEEEDGQSIVAEGFIQMGDIYIEENKFDEGITEYKNALDIFKLIKKPDKIVEVNTKISLANDRKREFTNSIKLAEIQEIVDTGDEHLKKNRYESAKQSYRQAQSLYQTINQIDKVLVMEEKIKIIDNITKNTNEKPTSTPTPTPEPTTGVDSE